MDKKGVLNDGASPNSYVRNGENFEDLNSLLTMVSVDLETTPEAIKTKDQLLEARVTQLEELLKTACRERDEFRDKCMQLQERSMSPRSINMGPVISHEPLLRTPSGLAPIETTVTPRKLEHVKSLSVPTTDTLAEVHRKLQEQQQQQLELEKQRQQQMDLQHHHTNHAQHELRQSSSTHLDVQSQHQLDHLLDQQLHLNMVMIKTQAVEQVHSGVGNGDAEGPTWTDFSSEGILELPPSELPIPHVPQLSPQHLDDFEELQQQQSWSSGQSMKLALPDLPVGVPIANGVFLSTSLQGGSAMAGLLSPLDYLPEPPESDPQVVLNSLPERGKLVQAVRDAGPLLSSIMLTGPLPQWKHPPPQLDPQEIPLVSMGMTVGCHQ